MNLDRVRPRSAVGRVLTMIACWSVAGVVGAVCSLRGWSPGWMLFVGFPATVGLSTLFLARTGEDGDRKAGYGPLLFWSVVLAVLTFSFSMVAGARLIVLDLWGERAVVRVVGDDVSWGERRGARYEDHCYRMSRLDGTPVPGEICRDNRREFNLDQTTEVVFDPDGFSGPEIPQKVARAHVARNVALGGFAALCLLAVVAGWGPTREPVSRPRPLRPSGDPGRLISPRPGKPRPPRRPRRGRRPGAGRRR
ncbi:hypothetical protein [Actinoplanes aureus]|uniref:DUF3592 domain-containing protein n=1 Tax=Actinoplanes aureus TaxID=2792083 RepID=A0A931CG77_9ACTN|nr:hypothetical protein [Actinoplanes aureus]MBG0565931.1 hypothetical protein [Actinoplanes aureus]